MTPMLARTYGPRFSSFPCFLQPKLNGIRCLYHNGIFQSRDEKLWKEPVLRHIQEQLSSTSFCNPNLILDGELYVHGWRLQRINGAVAINRLSPREDTRQVQYHVFDCIDLRDTTKSFSERYLDNWKTLQQQNVAQVVPVPTVICESATVLEHYFRQYTASGYEGVMLRLNAPYDPGTTTHGTQYRSRSLWKHKAWLDSEFRVVSRTAGDGKAAIGIGALTCVTPAGKTFNVGTGYTDEERIHFYTEFPKVIKVRYIGLSTDGIPLNPSFLCTLESLPST